MQNLNSLSLDFSLVDVIDEYFADIAYPLLDYLMSYLDKDLLGYINDLILHCIDVIVIHTHQSTSEAIHPLVIVIHPHSICTIDLIHPMARQPALTAHFRPRTLLKLIVVISLLLFIIVLILGFGTGS